MVKVEVKFGRQHKGEGPSSLLLRALVITVVYLFDTSYPSVLITSHSADITAFIVPGVHQEKKVNSFPSWELNSVL